MGIESSQRAISSEQLGERARLHLTDSPLSRAYEKYLRRSMTRSLVEIHWEGFQRAAYAPEALQLAADQALRLAEGEYNSIGLFGQIASGLALNGAPFDVIMEATTISHDEMRHAAYCLRFAELCHGAPLSLKVHRQDVVEIGAGLRDIAELDFFVLKYSAIGETLAATLIDACAARASDPVARNVYAALAADEVHHARMGWYYLSWRAAVWNLAEKQRLADRIAGMLMRLEKTFWRGRDASESAQADAVALGVMGSSQQRSLILAVVEQEIVPALDSLGLGASHAWKVRPTLSEA